MTMMQKIVTEYCRWLSHPPSLPLPFFWLLPRPTPGKTLRLDNSVSFFGCLSGHKRTGLRMLTATTTSASRRAAGRGRRGRRAGWATEHLERWENIEDNYDEIALLCAFVNFLSKYPSCKSLLFQFGDDSEVVEGTYSYLTPEGEEVEVSYTANENGYFPSVSDKIFLWLFWHN